MNKTLTVRIFASSLLETMWATGVAGVVGHLSTKIYLQASTYDAGANSIKD